jgi:hypothetical protein
MRTPTPSPKAIVFKVASGVPTKLATREFLTAPSKSTGRSRRES